MPKYRIELDDGTGTFVILDLDADNQLIAEDLAIDQVKKRPGADPDLVLIVSAGPL